MSNPHLIGLCVNLSPDVKEGLGLDWDEGEIFATVETDAGVAANILNPSTGQITPAIRLEGMKVTPNGLRVFRNTADTLAGKK